VHDEKAYYLNGDGGSAGLYSTVGDLLIFMKMMVNRGLYDNGKVFVNPESVDYFTTMIARSYHTTRAIGWDC